MCDVPREMSALSTAERRSLENNLIEPSKIIIEALVNGTMIIEVRMKLNSHLSLDQRIHCAKIFSKEEGC